MNEQKTVNVIARADLTETQVQTAIVEFLLKDPQLKDVIADKKLSCVTQWQTNKWSDPNALVHVFFTEVSAEISAETSNTTTTNDDNFGPDVSAPLGSPFFKESK
jgi:hypothetical protein